MGLAIGIDLGTTNCCVAAFVDGKPKILENRNGYRLTPSMIALTDNGRRLVGELAKRQAVTNPTRTIFGAKRLIGKPFASRAVERLRRMLPYDIVRAPNGEAAVRIPPRDYAIEELSAALLVELKTTVEETLSEVAESVVITIPAHFSDAQRQATLRAGEIAGLPIKRLINEPTAAALAFGASQLSKTVSTTASHTAERVAVFDLGGGTFDISILDLDQDVYRVTATGGDTLLGGDDLDRALVALFIEEFKERFGHDLLGDRMALQRLRDAAERAKIELSDGPTASINLPFLAQSNGSLPLHFERTLNRDEFETIALPFIDQTLGICERTLARANVSRQSIDRVLLVGGQTRTPLLRQRVQEYFSVAPESTVNPDEIVAQGAAVHAHALLNSEQGQPNDILLIDVTPHNLGIMTAGGYFRPIIKANTTVPHATTHTFTTARDEQTDVQIWVLEGDSDEASRNALLGEFALNNLRRAPRGEVQIDVTFRLDTNGMLTVDAIDRDTGKAQNLIVRAGASISDWNNLAHARSDNAPALPA